VQAVFAYVAEEPRCCFLAAGVNPRIPFCVPRYGSLSTLAGRDELGRPLRRRAYKRDKRPLRAVEAANPGEPSGPSALRPHGGGRPGWHIGARSICVESPREQSNISWRGIDRCFHTTRRTRRKAPARFSNIIADRMANGWCTNGFLQVEGDNMSVRRQLRQPSGRLLADWPGEVACAHMLEERTTDRRAIGR